MNRSFALAVLAVLLLAGGVALLVMNRTHENRDRAGDRGAPAEVVGSDARGAAKSHRPERAPLSADTASVVRAVPEDGGSE